MAVTAPSYHRELVHEMMALELFYEIQAGKPHNIDTYYFEEWIAEVASPEPNSTDEFRLEIEAKR